VQIWNWGNDRKSSPPLSFPFPLVLLPSLPLVVYPLDPARGLEKHWILPQWGMGQSPRRNRIWCILVFKAGGNNLDDFPENQLTTDFLSKLTWWNATVSPFPLSWYHLDERHSPKKYLGKRHCPSTTPLLLCRRGNC